VAKGKFENWITEDGLLLLKGWARDGLTDEEIAKKMGINVATLYRWKDKYCNICEALKKGREPVDVILEDTAFERATQWKTVKEITKELKFDRESGETRLMVTKEVEKRVPPDSTLLIFLMKNRMKDKYGDKQHVEISGQLDTNPFAGLTEEQLRKLAKSNG
jgi:transposase-like protein